MLRPLPPTPGALLAARMAVEMLVEWPPMSREDYQALVLAISRPRVLHEGMGWAEE